VPSIELPRGRAAQRGEQHRRAAVQVAQPHRLLYAAAPTPLRWLRSRARLSARRPPPGAQKHLGERNRVDAQMKQQAVTPLGMVGLGRRVPGYRRTPRRSPRQPPAPKPDHGQAEPVHIAPIAKRSAMWAATTSRAAAGMTVNDFSTRTQPIHAASREACAPCSSGSRRSEASVLTGIGRSVPCVCRSPSSLAA